MTKEWRIKKEKGGISGQFLDGCEIRKNADGTIDFLAVLATTTEEGTRCSFPEFAYQGLIWNIEVNSFNAGPRGDEVKGNWINNAPKLADDEDGTYTGQASSGGGVEEDAASASA